MKKVAVAGGFDPLHIGHLRHIQLAKKLGHHLVVLINPDSDLIKKKGYCFMPLAQRKAIVQELRCVDEVVEVIDGDGTCAETLKFVRPVIFAKGGDRVATNMPQNEIQACKDIGCKIIYGIGATLGSSSDLVAKVCNTARGGVRWANCKPTERISSSVYEINDLAQGGAVFSVTTLHPGQHTSGHLHQQDEFYLFLDRALLLLDGDRFDVKRGDIYLVQPNVYHQVHNFAKSDIQFACVWRQT